jgi:hypothetical protein
MKPLPGIVVAANGKGRFEWHIPLQRCSLVGWKSYAHMASASRAAVRAWRRLERAGTVRLTDQPGERHGD